MRNRVGWAGALLLLLLGGCPGGSEPLPVPPVPEAPAPVLVRQDVAEPETCAHGGFLVRSGLDANGDGRLDDPEIQHTQVICYPAPPREQGGVLVRLEPVLPGMTCAEGGSAVLSGVDADRDGTLADGEIQQRAVICRGRLLTRLSPVGNACPGLGVAMDVGEDINADGLLSQWEVLATQVTCSPVLTGDITVRSAEELVALASIRVIVGSLEIKDFQQESLPLPALEAVTGDVRLISVKGLKAVSLPALVSVGGSLELLYNPLLEEVDFAKLQRVEQRMTLDNNPRLTTVSGWPELRFVGELSLVSNVSLVDMRGFAKLRDIRGNVRVSGNDALVDCSLHLSQVGSVWVLRNAALKTMSLTVPAPEESFLPFVGDTRVEGNPALTALVLGLPWVRGNIQIFGNSALRDLTLTSSKIQGDLDIHSNGALTHLLASSLVRVEGNAWLSAPLEQLTLSPRWLSVLGDLRVGGTRLTAFSSTRYAVSVGGEMSFAGNSRLSSLSVSNLGGGLRVEGNSALTRLVIEGTSILQGVLSVASNPLLESIEGPDVTNIQGELSLFADSHVTRLNLPRLRRVGGYVSLRGPGLVALGLEELEFVGQGVSVSNTAMIRWTGLRTLRHVLGLLSVSSNPLLQEVSLPELRSSELVNIPLNPSLTRLSLPVLSSTKRADVNQNATLPVCEVERFFSQLPFGASFQSGNDANGTCTSP